MSLCDPRGGSFALIAAVAMALHAGNAAAADVLAKITTTTFNQFLGRLDPIAFSGRYAFRTTTDLGPFGRHTITWCDSRYSGSLNGLVTDINSTRIRVQGDVAFAWCGLNFGAPGKELVATGTVIYRASDHTLRLNFPSVIVRPTFNAFGFVIVLPVPVNLSGALNFPAIPLRTVGVALETPGGRRVMRVRPRNVDVDLGAGYVSVASDLSIL